MSATVKLKENRDFRRAYTRGRCYTSSALVTYVLKRRGNHCRIGITTSKKIGCAVARNRARRIISAAWRSVSPEVDCGADFVFVARTRTTLLKSTDIEKVMRKQLTEAGCIRKEQCE